ncbi:MAG TPA: hypothetical protein VLT33_16580 [Labilithrix sp.]|nr:hypothetical protein [Labilithrix sp.]
MWKTPLAVVALTLLGCSKDKPNEGPPGAASSVSAEPGSPPASVTPPPPASAPAPSATAAATPHDCPKGSTGEGSFDKPCEAKGNARLMDVTWNGKTDDKGPFFRVTNKSPLVIVYGKIAVYFYDKAGKQLEVPDDTVSPPKTVPFRSCSGNMFGGVMKAGEKAVLQFSCVGKKHVPEGTAAIEAEMQTVGFADATEKKVDFYWRNPALTPDARKKGAK